MVQTNTVVLPGSDAAVIRIKPLDAEAITEQDRHAAGESASFLTRGLGITVDCNSRYCYLNPYEGSVLAVAEAARNLSCSGATPKGVTDCLNFANPEKPHVFWQFQRSVEGLAAACEAFETPVVSGNVSFYNETPETAIYPTPAIGMVGVFDDVSKRCVSAFQGAGDRVYLLGPASPPPDHPNDGIGGSEYLSLLHGVEAGKPPRLDLPLELRLQRLLRALISDGLLRSAHDCSDGGLAVALSECALLGDTGATLRLPDVGASATWQLFAEAQSRVVVTVSPESEARFLKAVQDAEMPRWLLGETGGDALIIGDQGAEIVRLGLEEGRALWKDAIEKLMEEGNPTPPDSLV
jgi:phosphoribosylformylglycinamidine synthase